MVALYACAFAGESEGSTDVPAHVSLYVVVTEDIEAADLAKVAVGSLG